LAGSGTSAKTVEGTPAIRASLPQETTVAALPGTEPSIAPRDSLTARGGFLIGDASRVWRVDPDGLIHLAATHLLEVGAIAALPGGGFLVADARRVWSVDPQGALHPTDVEVATALAPLPGGGFVFADGTSHVGRVGPDGRLAAAPDIEADDLSPAPDGS